MDNSNRDEESDTDSNNEERNECKKKYIPTKGSILYSHIENILKMHRE